MSFSKIFFFLSLSFIIGVFLCSFFYSYRFVFLILFSISFIFFLIFKREKALVVFLCLVFTSLGMGRFSFFEDKVNNPVILKYFDKKVEIAGMVTKEPEQREKDLRLVLKVRNIGNDSINEKILIVTDKNKVYSYGDILKVKGKLREPKVFEDFDYRMYLGKEGVYGIVYSPIIEITEKDKGSRILSLLFRVKQGMKRGLDRSLEEPHSSFIASLFFGDEGVSEDLKTQFNNTGTRHILAVSGMNITIICSLILNLLLSLGLWRKQAFYISVISIVLYIIMIGFSSSAVRAGIMGIIYLLAQVSGRKSLGQRAVTFAASFMLFFNPLLLKADIGFQLSFAAMLGLIYLQPILSGFLLKVPEFFQLRSTLSATLSAQLSTLPITIYYFSYFFLLSPIVNILIVPLIPIITALGFLSSILGIISHALGTVLSFPSFLVSTYILGVINIFSSFSFVLIDFKKTHFFFFLFLYLVFLFFILFAYRKTKEKRLKFLKY